MDEDALNMSVRKFLKKVGITSQREIEKVIKQAVADGVIDQSAVCKVSMQLSIEVSDKPLVIDGEIHLS
jgi:16S rRNA U516 pseudouridylate synthase RsuA-like enzyme